MNQNLYRRGFTLVELLIVISIIGLLIQLLLPAVQAAREAARSAQCKNNLRQIAAAGEIHIATQGHLPSGGWTHTWVADPDRGYGPKQPGGWQYNLLPFIEEQTLHDLGKGLPANQKRLTAKQQFETPVAIYICPSRRTVVAYPFVRFNTLVNADNPDVAGRSDYAANMGNLEPTDQRASGPKTLEEGDAWNEGTDGSKSWVAMYHNGVIYQRSHVKPQQITDGLSKTFLIGEKFLSPECYLTGTCDGDDHGVPSGFDRDNGRSTNSLHPPMHDHLVPQVWLRYGDNESVTDWNFGGAHPSGFHVALCDGSVQQIQYGIDAVVYSGLGSRNGGEVTGVE